MIFARGFHWTRDRVLAATALALGALAIAGSPTRGHTVRIDTQELAAIVSSEVDHVTAAALAGRILAGDADYRLVDLREPAEYEAYHIPTAENVALSELVDFGLGRNENIVLYSGGGIHSAQAWFLLRAQGYHGVRILSGGLDAWKSEVMFPVAPVDSTADAVAAFARAAEVARHFGGAPRAAAGAALATPAIEAAGATAARPKVDLPKVPAAGKAAPAGKKKREGC